MLWSRGLIRLGRHTLLCVVLVALLGVAASGCGIGDEAATKFEDAAGLTDYLSEDELEERIRDDTTHRLTGTKLEVRAVECDKRKDDGSEWNCEVRSLGEKVTTSYFVEVSKDGTWAGQIDLDEEARKLEDEIAREEAELEKQQAADEKKFAEQQAAEDAKFEQQQAEEQKKLDRELRKICTDAGLPPDCSKAK